MKLKLTPIQETLIFLAIYGGLAAGFSFNTEILVHGAATILFGAVLYFVYSKTTGKKKMFANTLITSIIIFLVSHYAIDLSNISGVVVPLIATFIAVTWKFIARLPHINPAVLGLLAAALIAKILPGVDDAFLSWWGASYQGYISLVLILAWLVIGLRKWRKYPILITFLATMAIGYAVRNQFAQIQFTFTDASIYFFAGIMLIEPKTSPIMKKEQIIYGIIAALAYHVLSVLHVPYFELFAIVTANLYFLAHKEAKKRSRVTIKA